MQRIELDSGDNRLLSGENRWNGHIEGSLGPRAFDCRWDN